MSTAPAPAGPLPEPVAVVPPPPAKTGASNRRLRNYLLDTGLQLRLASYLIGVAVLLSVFLGFKLYEAWRETSKVIALSDPETGDSLAAALAAEDRGRIVLVSAALVFILLLLLASAIVITHRIAGPAFALGRTCHRVAEGNLTRPWPLRRGDLLVDLAGEVSHMVDALRDRETAEREFLEEHAARLRGLGGEAASVAGKLEALAKEKAGRLGKS
ncbi:MAG: hypothetical protein QM704_15585 [Anaeromyxobacteraceae bacterium]